MPLPAHAGARAHRAARAAQRWAEATDTHGAPVELLERAAADAADELRRDLTLEEVNAICLAAVDAEDQRHAEEAIASAREEERLAYLRQRAEDYRLQGATSGRR